MPDVDASPTDLKTPDDLAAALRRELDRCRAERAECEKRLRETEAHWRQSQAWLQGEKSVLEMISSGRETTEVLTALCHLVEGLMPKVHCSILMIDARQGKLRRGVAPSLPGWCMEAVDGRPVGPDAGPCGRAAYYKEMMVVPDILEDPRGTGGYREPALAMGFRACFSSPILASSGGVLGTFALYQKEPGRPTPHQETVLAQFAHLAAIAIEQGLAHDRLRKSEASLALAQRLSATGSFSWNAAHGEMTCSEETCRICGLEPGQTVTGDQMRNLIHPGDLPRFREILTSGAGEFRFECRLVLQHGVRKHLEVVGTASRDEEGRLLEWAGSVMDITSRKQAAEALRASENLARGQLETLRRTLDNLVHETRPDRLLEHVLAAMVDYCQAHGASVWARDATGAWLDLVAVVEADGRFQPAGAATRFPFLSSRHPVWREVLRSGKAAVLEGLDQPVARIRVFRPGEPRWHPFEVDGRGEAGARASLEGLHRMGVSRILYVPMIMAGQVEGIAGVRFQEIRELLDGDVELTRALAHQAMLAIQLTRMAGQERRAAVMEERNRMARDIHDTLAQGFTGVIVQLEAAADARTCGLDDEAEAHVERAASLARSSLDEARRSVKALRPGILQAVALPEALRQAFTRMTAGCALQVHLDVLGAPCPLPPAWEDHLLRVAQEALTNALRHAGASRFTACLQYGPALATLELEDDGRGFAPLEHAPGFGLTGIRERVQDMAGSLQILSAPGAGTKLIVSLPLPEAAQHSGT